MSKIFILSLLISTQLFATDYEVAEVNQSKEIIAVWYKNGDNQLVVGDSLTATVDGKTCSMPIERISNEKKFVVVSSKGCPFGNELRKGTALTISLLNSNDLVEATSKPVLQSSDSNLRSKNEDWYIYFGLGFGSARYNDKDLQDALDRLKDDSSVSHITVVLDLVGFYYPVFNHSSMIGFLISGVGETFEQNDEKISIYQYQYSFSAMRFFGTNIGDGPFIRGDIGPTRFRVEGKNSQVSVSEESDWGLGFTLGGGYAVPLSSEARLLLNTNISLRDAEGDKVTTLAFTAGFLF